MTLKVKRGVKRQYERGHCKGCGAEIIWAKIDDKPIPLNPVRVMTYLDAAAEHPVLGNDWRRSGSRYVGHHTTCPKVGDFKKPKKGGQ